MERQPFPPDLVEAQIAWYATYWQLASGDPAAGTTQGRRRLRELSVRIAGHPYWRTAGATPAARMELKELARRACAGER
ncbi:hypothetical protein [Streptomyces sp. HNM0574]|uniref:hypothetical protein n=1 Tax=Streptomyces sp. HNM0574 TaxID=2714954 RepID=UPI00146A773E|nr:hypothetical protein [Streptomyces sp. HNM0574]NLU69444.1 hypothetical protein [Streptomyces sp. HNM0574]